MRVHGSIGIKPLECINPPKNRWAARWDFLDEENGSVSYEEEIFDHEPTDEEIEAAMRKRLSEIRAELTAKIAAHDTSNEVNSLTVAAEGVGNVPMWLNREERSALRIRFEAEQRAGVTVTTLWAASGLSLTITPEIGIAMLDRIELYAAACYDRTQQHLIAASGLASRSECEEYDFTGGYPEKLTFNA
jgi:hypothetical protein